MNSIKQTQSDLINLTLVMFLSLCALILLTGCQKKSPERNIKIDRAEVEEPLAAVSRNSDQEIPFHQEITTSPFSSPAFPELMIAISLDDDEFKNVVAFRDLRIEEAATDSERLRLANSEAMHDMVHEVFLHRNSSIYDYASKFDSSMPLLFQYPWTEDRRLKRLKGSVTAILSGKSQTLHVPNLFQSIKNSSQLAGHPDGTQGVELPPVSEDQLPSYAITFPDTVFISDARLLDREKAESLNHWCHVEVLPDGRPRVLIEQSGQPITESVSLQYTIHSKLESRNIQFDFDDPFLIPEIEQNDRVWKRDFSKAQVSRKGSKDSFRVQAYAEIESQRSDIKTVGDASPIEVHVEVFGDRSPNTIAIGELKLEQIESDIGPIRISENNFLFYQMQNGLHFYSRNDAPSPPPIEGASVSIPLKQPRSTPKLIEKLKGELTLLTADSHEYLMVHDITVSLGKVIEHPALNAADIDLIPEMFGEEIRFTIDPKQAFQISEITALDESGATSWTIYSGRQMFDQKSIFSLQSAEVLPEKIPVRIRINHGLVENHVPFEFENLPISVVK